MKAGLLATIAAATLAGALVAPASAVSSRSAAAPVGLSPRGSTGGLTQGPVHVLFPATSSASTTPPSSSASSNQLAYGGGTGGRGVQQHPAVYLVFWGSQWDKTDPYAAYEQRFFRGLYGRGDDWTRVESQYCDHVPTGTVSCPSTRPHIQGPLHGGVLKGVWFDDSQPAVPTNIVSLRVGATSLDPVAAEAVRAAQHFGNNTAAGNAETQYVINEPTKFDTPGFGVSYCAYHSTVTGPGLGSVVYTELPYLTDIENPAHTGLSCGQNMVNAGTAGTYDGVSIVAGHEFGESVTDPYPDTGWVDGSGLEDGDKCAWISSGQGAMGDLKLSTGVFAVQSMWSNAFNNSRGGCVLHQH